jgi:hypothetical protein
MGTIFANRAHAGLLELAGTRKNDRMLFSLPPKETTSDILSKTFFSPLNFLFCKNSRHGFVLIAFNGIF